MQYNDYFSTLDLLDSSGYYKISQRSCFSDVPALALACFKPFAGQALDASALVAVVHFLFLSMHFSEGAFLALPESFLEFPLVA